MDESTPKTWQRKLSRVVFRLGRSVGTRLPRIVSRNFENRVFYAIFNVTRVTNDAYGWRPTDQEDAESRR